MAYSDHNMGVQCCGIFWSRILLLRAICVNISFIALILIIVLINRNPNIGDWVSIHDTRVLTYHRSCNGTDPAAKSCALATAVDQYIKNITKDVQCTAESHFYDDPRSTKGVIWREEEPLFRYIFVNKPTFSLRFWGDIFSHFNLSLALVYVYTLSLCFQLYTFYYEYRRKPAFTGKVIGTLYSGTTLEGQPLLGRDAQGQNVFDLTAADQAAHLNASTVDIFRPEHATGAADLTGSAAGSAVCKVSPWDPGFADGASFLRWVEYGLTSSVQIVVFSLMMQNTSVNEAAMLLLLQLVLCLLGYIVEYEIDGIYGTCENDHRFVLETQLEKMIRSFRLCFVHLTAWVVHIVLWSIIFENFNRFDKDAKHCVNKYPGAPTFVRVLIYSQGVFFSSFGLVQFLQVCVLVVWFQWIRALPTGALYTPHIARWQRITAYGYAVLNVVSKFFIAIILLGGLA
jgi:hypothetical protein